MSPARRAQLCLLLIAGCVFATFGRIGRHEFLYWDDHVTLSGNADLNPVTLRGVASYWAKEKQDLYIPVTYAVWGALATIAQTPAGLDPHIFHAASVVVHTISACLAFAILRLLTKSDLAACAGALLFALHPVQVEPVAWASGMKDVLCGALSLLAIWQYLLFTSTGRRWHYAVATGAFVLAMLSKPSAVTVPLIAAAALDVLLVRRGAEGSDPVRGLPTAARSAAPGRAAGPTARPGAALWAAVTDSRFLPLAVWLLLAAPIVIATRKAQPAEYVYDAPLWLRPIVAWDALAWYARHLVAPQGFAVDYGRAPQRVLPPDALTIAGWIGFAILVIACWALRRRWPWLAAGVAVLVLAVAPVLGLVRFDFQKYSTVADHYLYVAMLGPALIAAAVVARARRQKLAAAAVGLLALTCGITSARQAAHWRNTESLFAHTLQVNQNSFAARATLGYLARERGDAVRASDHYVAALLIYPDDATANFNLARILLDLRQFPRAIQHFERAIAAKPDDPQFRNNYAVALFLAGRRDEAIAQLESILAKQPGFTDAATNLAKFRAIAASQSATQRAP